VSILAIAPAAGRGERLGFGTPKALRLFRGAPLFAHAVRTLSRLRSAELMLAEALLAVLVLLVLPARHRADGVR
jgi:2-C-methyl-D-erythritol 4-phosphate cytidylyltransferase